MDTKELRLAVLIDAENVPHSSIKGIMEEITKYGIPTIKRIYGDWTKSVVSGWKNVLLVNAITPIQQYGYTNGKNSSDSALIIDAMDILYTEKVEGFCIVSSDSDFTRLAIRLREAGMKVFGFGERKTPNPLIVACDKFTYIEIISKVDTSGKVQKDSNAKVEEDPIIKISDENIALISSTIEDIADEQGWAFLAEVGNLIQKKQPDFDARNYGFLKLTPLIRSLKQFEIDERDTSNNKIKHIFVRNKKQEASTKLSKKNKNSYYYKHKNR